MFSRKIGNLMSDELSKINILESKFEIYENLSREMLEKLENAVDKISESNQRIANILTKHDERIEQAAKTDQLIIDMINGVKESNTKDHKSVNDRMKSLEDTVNGLLKFRWQASAFVGILLVSVTLVSSFVPNILDNMSKARYHENTHSRPLK